MKPARDNILRPNEIASDADLLARYRAGEQAAGQALYRRHAQYVRTKLLRVLGFDRDLDDALQQVFVEAIENLERLREHDKFRAWLGAIAINVARGMIRRRQRSRQIFDEHTVDSDAPCGQANTLELHNDVYRLLAQLTPDERIPLVLQWIDRCSLSEIATLCKTSQSTAKRRIRRGKKRLQKLIESDKALMNRMGRDNPHDNSGGAGDAK